MQWKAWKTRLRHCPASPSHLLPPPETTNELHPDRCVLAAQSFPLRAMFEGAFKEGREDVIALRDVDPSSFALLLDFWYDGNVEITAENVEALLDLSARYGVSLLRRRCCAFVARSATPSTACSLLAVADRYDCRRLKRDLLAYTLQVPTKNTRHFFRLRCCAPTAGGESPRLGLLAGLYTWPYPDDKFYASPSPP